MTSAVLEHPRHQELVAQARAKRWPYTPVGDWLSQVPTTGDPPPLAAFAAPADWQAIQLSADEPVSLADGQCYWLGLDVADQWACHSGELHLGAGQKASLLLSADCGAGAVLDVNPRIVLAAGSELRLIRVANHAGGGNGFENWQIELADQAELHCTEVNLGNGRTHVDVRIDLAGPAARARWNSLSLLGANARAVNHMHIRHLAADTYSRLDVRNAIAGRARRSLIGMVEVARAGQGTDSAQMCRSLLLSGKAAVDMRPELEIYADQVQCAHGATCGDLDTTALHYLRSRGIDPLTARQLLLEGFALPLLDDLPESLGPTLRDASKAKLASFERENT